MEYKYARRMSYVTASEIRELLKLTEQPEVILFAGACRLLNCFPLRRSKLQQLCAGPQRRTRSAVCDHRRISAPPGVDRCTYERTAWHFLLP